jgi:flagellar basal-body rod protein FlgB
MGNLIENTILRNTAVPHLRQLAQLASKRHKLIASNVANVNTPGYERQSFDFDSALKKAFDKPKVDFGRTHENHIPLEQSRRLPRMRSDSESENTTGVNSVDVDQEMADLAQNQLIYEYGAKRLKKQFEGLRKAIRGR